MAGAKTWHLLPHDEAAIARLARALDAPPILAQLLLNRKLTDPQAARRDYLEKFEIGRGDTVLDPFSGARDIAPCSWTRSPPVCCDGCSSPWWQARIELT